MRTFLFFLLFLYNGVVATLVLLTFLGLVKRLLLPFEFHTPKLLTGNDVEVLSAPQLVFDLVELLQLLLDLQRVKSNRLHIPFPDFQAKQIVVPFA